MIIVVQEIQIIQISHEILLQVEVLQIYNYLPEMQAVKDHHFAGTERLSMWMEERTAVSDCNILHVY